MSVHPHLLRRPGLIGRFLLFLLVTGCSTPPTKVFLRGMAYEPERSPVRLEASATIECAATLSPAQHDFFRQQGLNDATIANMISARGQTIRHDLEASGIFTRVTPPAGTQADYLVKCHWEDDHITLTVTQPATGRRVSDNRLEFPPYNPNSQPNALPALMAALKTTMIADLQGKPRPGQQLADQAEAARRELAALDTAPLADLLAASDKSATFARARNRAIIAAKNRQLPAMLRDSKTSDLAAFVVRIEQTVLDLNHESELAKDHAQQATAAGGDPARIDEIRGLSLSYRERIELLKPILAALKEEIANRSR